jgi:hypothetical protein
VIHTWLADSRIAPEVALKQIRKLAMTGGVEITLSSTLGEDEVVNLVQQWLPHLERYEVGSSAYRSSTAYRILEAVAQDARYCEVAELVTGFQNFLSRNHPK